MNDPGDENDYAGPDTVYVPGKVVGAPHEAAQAIQDQKDGIDRMMRLFETGATRNVDDNQFDYEGFLHPLVLREFAQYMHDHRTQADGTIRDSDNWQKGIPVESYMKSLTRHHIDVWLHHRGYPQEAREGYVAALCAIMFNAMGLLYEELKDDAATDQ